MATIDIDTETGLIRYPMRRVEGVEEFRVRAWIELVTFVGEWVTDTSSGLDYDAIMDDASDDAIAADIEERLKRIPGYQGLDGNPEIERDTDPSDPSITITVRAKAFDEVITISTGAAQ